MDQPQVMQELTGLVGLVLAVMAIPAATTWLVLLGLTAAKWRIPAIFWWLPPALILVLATGMASSTAAGLPDALAVAPLTQVSQLALLGLAGQVAPSAVAWFLVAMWCTLSSLGVATASAWSIEYPVSTWVAGTLPAAAGLSGIVLALAVALLTGSPAIPLLTLIVLSLAGVLSLTLSGFRASLSKSERIRLGATRALILSFSMLAPMALGIGWHRALMVAAWTSEGPSPDPVLPTATAMTLAIAAAGLPTLSTARGALANRRSLASAASVAVLFLAVLALGMLTRPAPELVQAATGGAVGALPDPLWSSLPRAQDLTEAEVEAPEFVGSCLIAEASDGWTLEPLFALQPGEICPAAAALTDPLPTSLVPVVALDGRRSIMALSGRTWFDREGQLQVLVQPDPLATADQDLRNLKRRPRTIALHWEQPPPVTPPEEHVPGTWDDAWAADLPVTLLEGPYPVLVAGGLRSRLPVGSLGRDTLQLALATQDPHRRDLVIVPRKEWTVQDALRFCSSIASVEHARCVVRPETPIKWSLRTGLPLPW